MVQQYLQINETLVSVRCHLHSSQDGSDNKRSHVRRRRPRVNLKHVLRVKTPVQRGRAFLLEYQQPKDESFHTQQIVAVCWYFHLEDDRLWCTFRPAADGQLQSCQRTANTLKIMINITVLFLFTAQIDAYSFLYFISNFWYTFGILQGQKNNMV